MTLYYDYENTEIWLSVLVIVLCLWAGLAQSVSGSLRVGQSGDRIPVRGETLRALSD